MITLHLLAFASLSCLKPSPRSSKDFLLFISPLPPAPLASYTPISVGPWQVWAVSTLVLHSPTKSAYFRLLPSNYQLSSWMSKVDLTTPAQTSWLQSSPEEVFPLTWLPGSSLPSPNASADLYSKAPKVFCPVAVVTPQGSPISPLLFVLYIASLHPTVPQGLAISYVDDLTITVGSDFVCSNIRALQYYFSIIQRQGADLGVALSVPKTELIHWRTPNDHSDVSFAPIVINDMLFPPSQVVRWLGYWHSPTLDSSVHFLRRLALAKASFTTIRQLSAAGEGHSSWCNRNLLFSAILPILTYGCDLFVLDEATLKRLNSSWHAVLR